MIASIKKSYEHTIYASYLGYIVQAIVNNFAPLLFLTFATQYDLSLDKITLITTINFLVQLTVDFLSARYIDKIGYRKAIMLAHVFSAIGLAGLAIFPKIFPSAYAGILAAVCCYAIGGGIIEVLVSPIVEACPTKKKEAAMSLLHSFYCWGHVAVVLVSTGFFVLFGIDNWEILAVIWAIVPFVNIFYFGLVPIYPIDGGHETLTLGNLLRQKVFWLLITLMICAGASEHAMSQWVSAFAESVLGSKTIGDLVGPCAFAICMGIARALYGKYSEQIPLKKMMAGSAALCIVCYIIASFSNSSVVGLLACAVCGFSVAIFWPGTFSMAAITIPGGSTAMYAFMALAGDLGCSSGPTVVGMIANAFAGDFRKGFLCALVFPVVMLLGITQLKKR